MELTYLTQIDTAFQLNSIFLGLGFRFLRKWTRWQLLCFTQSNTEAGPGVWGFLVKQVTSFSFWVISPSGSELPAVQLHTCRKWTTPNQPSWGFFVAWAGLSIVISNGILGPVGVQEIKSWLCYPSIAAQSQALSSGRPFPSQNLGFCSVMPFKFSVPNALRRTKTGLL